jgi:1-acyl-sn-glycerol-3-phosphate acyltransferase
VRRYGAIAATNLVNFEYVLLPFVGWSCLTNGAVVMVRQWPAQARRAIARAEAALRGGRNLVFSIEGNHRAPQRSL